MRTPDKYDVLFRRGSEISQIVVALVAIVAYFYTVRPIYEKERLSEEVAQKTLELKKIEDATASLRASQEIFVRERDEAMLAARKASLDLEEKNQKLASLGEIARALEEKVAHKSELAARADGRASDALYILFLEKLEWVVLWSDLYRNESLHESVKKDYAKAISSTPKVAHQLIADALPKLTVKYFEKDLGKKGVISEQDIGDYAQRVRAAAAANERSLKANKFEIKALLEQYPRDFAAEKVKNAAYPYLDGLESTPLDYVTKLQDGQRKNSDAALSFIRSLKPAIIKAPQ